MATAMWLFVILLTTMVMPAMLILTAMPMRSGRTV